VNVPCVPLATEPVISLIILTPMKILQRNLNRGTFVVGEMKRNVSVVCVCSAPNCCDTERRSASQPGSVASGTHVCWIRKIDTKFRVVNPEGKSNLKDLGVDGNVILKWDVKNTVGHVECTNVAQDRYMRGLL
jgi:hypothetical protein